MTTISKDDFDITVDENYYYFVQKPGHPGKAQELATFLTFLVRQEGDKKFVQIKKTNTKMGKLNDLLGIDLERKPFPRVGKPATPSKAPTVYPRIVIDDQRLFILDNDHKDVFVKTDNQAFNTELLKIGEAMAYEGHQGVLVTKNKAKSKGYLYTSIKSLYGFDLADFVKFEKTVLEKGTALERRQLTTETNLLAKIDAGRLAYALSTKLIGAERLFSTGIEGGYTVYFGKKNLAEDGANASGGAIIFAAAGNDGGAYVVTPQP